MKDLKSTLTGVTAVLVGLATYKGWIDETVGSYITAGLGLLFAYFVADGSDTPTPTV